MAHRLIPFAVGTGAMFLLGTAAHEITHWVAARSAGADIESVRLHPPSPEVVYVAATPGVDAWIKACTVPAALLLTAAVVAALPRLGLTEQLLLCAFLAGYLPRSNSDWAPIREFVSEAATGSRRR